ncbi:unnamed protein product [Dracunculus medinensis]|uniref:ANF_receptor domain-containing protein n=1 Tax=Dracunculus medinensis TaxID=318479 RepID=A0A0N4U7B9_DRAME|nr:unnamed protein product [Dracunculus medinensis]
MLFTVENHGGILKWKSKFDRPMLGALFLPPNRTVQDIGGVKNLHLAHIDSVKPILDIAIEDAWQRYLTQWKSKSTWLEIFIAPINECEDQKRVAWAALEAIQWTNGSGLDVAFGPACDYVLATANRILSFSGVPMFTSAGFSEFFKDKERDAELIIRVGPVHDHIDEMIEEISRKFGWTHMTLFYEKNFWKSELLESGFCKMLMNGLFVRAANKRSNLKPNPQMLPKHNKRKGIRNLYKKHLIENVGTDRAGRFFFNF